MKAITEPLRNFITDFKLENNEKIVCFGALIYFSAQYSFILLPTEVQIVTIGTDTIDVVYLLHSDVMKHGIPDMYIPGDEEFRYEKNKALIIKGNTPLHGNYILAIHPENKHWIDAATNEVYSKSKS
jgi:hypothetical protein